jgi:RNA polymerase sigma factor (sigma-70 family)
MIIIMAEVQRGERGVMASSTAIALRKVIQSVGLASASDGDLLCRFARENDQTAFATLFRRHSPMVLGVCQRALPTMQDAEDACQATFLLLARKAKTGRWQTSVANWLYTTARKVAANAARAVRRRATHEAHAGRSGSVQPVDMSARELLASLDEELAKLPPYYREPLLLCYLEGLTRDEAARRLGLPLGTVKIHLERGRKRLHDALIRRGLGLGAGLLVLASTSRARASAPVLDKLILAAISGRAPAAVTAFAEGLSMTGFLNKSASLILAAVAAAALGVGLASVSVTAGGQKADRTEAPGLPQLASAGKDALGDPLPVGAVARLGTTRLRHGDDIFFAAYTPDGKALLTAGMDQNIRLWELPTGKELRRFGFDWRRAPLLGEVPPYYAVALSSDGKRVAVAREGALSLWDVATGMLLHRKPIEGRLLIAFVSDGNALLTVNSSDGSTQLWDVALGKSTRQFTKLSTERSVVTSMAVSPDGKYLAWTHYSGTGAATKIKDLSADRELPEFPIKGDNFTFSADSKTLAWSEPDGSVVLWDLARGKERIRFGRGESHPGAVAMSADGMLVAVCHGATVEIWDGGTGRKLASANGPAKVFPRGVIARPIPGALAFSPDAKVVSASFGGPSIIQFETTSGSKIARPHGGHQNPVAVLGPSSDSRCVMTYGHGEPLRRWDPATGREIGEVRIPENTLCTACSADGQRIVAAVRNRVIMYDAAGKELLQLQGVTRESWTNVRSLALSPDGRVLAVRESNRAEVRLWDVTTGKDLVTLAQTESSESAFASEQGKAWGLMSVDLIFSPDGRSIFGADAKRQLVRWDSRSGEAVWTVPLGAEQAVERFAINAGGHTLATLNNDGTVTLYETATGQPRAHLGRPDGKPRGERSSLNSAHLSIPRSFPDEPFAVAFSRDGRLLATANCDRVIRLWDIVAGQEIRQLKGHQGGVISVMFAAGYNRLLSGSADTTVLTWNLGHILKKAGPDGKLDPTSVDALWIDLASKNSAKAFAALRRLATAPAQAAALVKERVRAVASPEPKAVAALIDDLQSGKLAARQKAEISLEALGDQVEPELRKALAGDPPATLRQRLERLLRRVAIGQDVSAEVLRDLRAIELLELASGPDARCVLEELAHGAAGARLTREAQAAAQRLAQ